jgi:DNA-nicking Smr family endonuclease
VSEENSRRYARRLSQAEAELWMVATADVRPARARPKRPAPPPAAGNAGAIGAFAFGGRPAPEASAAADRLDPRTFVKIKRGRIGRRSSVFTGCGRRRRSASLTAFLRRCQANGARIAIIVMTRLTRDEGGAAPRRADVAQAPICATLSLGFGEAARHHGGEGALYVRIRRADRAR